MHNDMCNVGHSMSFLLMWPIILSVLYCICIICIVLYLYYLYCIVVDIDTCTGHSALAVLEERSRVT